MSTSSSFRQIDRLISLMQSVLDSSLDSDLKPNEYVKCIEIFSADYKLYQSHISFLYQNGEINAEQLSQLRKQLDVALNLLGQLKSELKIIKMNSALRKKK